MKIAILDKVHPLFESSFHTKDWKVDILYDQSRDDLKKIIHQYDGIILRSRIKMDVDFLSNASNLKFIGRPGAGLENIDVEFCQSNNIKVFRSPEGNRDAVGEHVIGSLLMLFNNLKRADLEVRNGVWLREENRGHELKGKTFAIIGYGFMGEAVAKKLSGFECNTIAYDKYKSGFGNDSVKEVTLEDVFETADIISLNTPLTEDTRGMINSIFLNQFKKDIYLINTARGNSVITKDLIETLKSGKVIGACLDVFDFESSTFQESNTNNPDFDYLSKSEKVILSPHIAGWTHESKLKMAEVLLKKIFTQ